MHFKIKRRERTGICTHLMQVTIFIHTKCEFLSCIVKYSLNFSLPFSFCKEGLWFHAHVCPINIALIQVHGFVFNFIYT
jgi:hypothetical protein